MKRVLLFTVFLASAIVSWADECSSGGDNFNWTAVSAIVNVALVLVAIFTLRETRKEIKLMHSNSKTDIYVRYRARFNINSDLRKVQEYLDNKNRQNNEGHSPKPNAHQKMVFIQYYEEIGFLIDKNRIDSEILSGPIAKYLLMFDEQYHKREDMHYDSLQCDEFRKVVNLVKKNNNINLN